MKNIAIILTFATTLIVIITLSSNPSFSAIPGDISSYHHKIRDDCLRCHTYFNGIPQEKCIKCHEVNQIGFAKEKFSLSFHRYLADKDCKLCHTEHLGADSSITLENKINHEAFQTYIRDKCSNCHIKPADNTHIKYSAECSNCHSTANWSFHHSQVQSEIINNCSSCHQRPDDQLHAGNISECSSCHSITSWKGATFEHQKYFVFDQNHPSDCSTCHSTPNNYIKWTCYGCHEHTVSRIQEKHLKEGIRNFENCIKCHRSGNEHGQASEKGKKNESHSANHEEEGEED